MTDTAVPGHAGRWWRRSTACCQESCWGCGAFLGCTTRPSRQMRRPEVSEQALCMVLYMVDTWGCREHWQRALAAVYSSWQGGLKHCSAPSARSCSRGGQALWLLQAVCGWALRHSDSRVLQRVPPSMSAAAGVTENRVQNLVVALDKVKFFLEQPGELLWH